MSAETRSPRVPQLARFGVVGVGATLLHAAVYLLAATGLGWPALAGNTLGFVCAFGLSYYGHRHWTFVEHRAASSARRSLMRFLLISLGGFASNSFFTWLLVDRLQLPKPSALSAMLFATPLLVFVASKYWGFRGESTARTTTSETSR